MEEKQLVFQTLESSKSYGDFDKHKFPGLISPRYSDSVDLKWDLITCFSNKLPSAAAVAFLGIIV